MKEPNTFLIVHRVGGMLRRSRQESLYVMVDDHRSGVIGEEILVAPGERWVTVKTPFFTCLSMQIELQPGSTTRLEYHSTWLAMASVVFGFVFTMVLAIPVGFCLQLFQKFVVGKFLPHLLEFIVLLGGLGLVGWLAFCAPLRVLAIFGMYSHRLSVQGQTMNSREF